jgi:hypothetical protein
MDKKILNEELNVMKYLLQYDRGVVISEQKLKRVNEAGPFQDTDACINYEAGKGLELVNNINQQIQGLNVNDEISLASKIVNNSELKKPEMKAVIDKLEGALSSELPNMSADDIKGMITKLKSMKNNPPKNVNEQVGTGTIMSVLSAVPGWGWSLIITWLILRLLRCYVYKLQSKLFTCAFNWAKSPLRYLTNILLLDFKNLTSGRTIIGCR